MEKKHGVFEETMDGCSENAAVRPEAKKEVHTGSGFHSARN